MVIVLLIHFDEIYIVIYMTIFSDITLIENKIGSNKILAKHTTFLEEFVKEL